MAVADSADAGPAPPPARWRAQASTTTADLASVSFPDAAHGWAVGAGGTIVATVDGGRTWRPEEACSGGGACGPDSADRVRADLASVSFPDAAHGWAVGAGGTIVATADGGRTWARQKAPDRSDICTSRPPSPANPAGYTSVAFTDDAEGVVTGPTQPPLHTVDGGRTWAMGPPLPTNACGVTAVAAPQPGVQRGVGRAGRAVLGGRRTRGWHAEQDSDTRPTATTEDLHALAFTDNAHGWAVGDGGAIVATADEGEDWVAQPSGTTQRLRGVSFPDADDGWAVGDGGTILALHTTPVGLSVARVSPPRAAVVGAITVTITGAGFAHATDVDFGSRWAHGFVVHSDTEITAEVPAHPPGRVAVTVGTASQVSAPGPGSVFVFEATSGGTATPTAPCAAACLGPAVRLGDGRVLVVGDCVDNARGAPCDIQETAEIFDPATRTWATTSPMRQPRTGQSATLLADGRVLVAGGVDPTTGDFAPLASAEVYDPATGDWHVAGDMAGARTDHTATLLTDGKVLVAGGVSNGPSAELFNPATATWSPTGPMVEDRRGATATRLASGRVLVVGGDPADPGSAEIYNPATNTWAATAPLLVPRTEFSATLLTNGKVLVAGGLMDLTRAQVPVPYAELFDPTTATWSPTGPMLLPRYGHTATLLADGRVLVAGGQTTVDDPGVGNGLVADIEVYDPAAGRWDVGVAMARPRVGHSATALGGDRVLVAGGTDAQAVAGMPSGTLIAAGEIDSAPPIDHPGTGLLDQAARAATWIVLPVAGVTAVAGALGWQRRRRRGRRRRPGRLPGPGGQRVVARRSQRERARGAAVHELSHERAERKP